LIENNELPVTTLPLVGFEFLQNFIIGVNESQSNLVKVVKPVKTNTYSSYGGYGMKFSTNYMSMMDQDDEKESGDAEDATFKLVINPSKLLHMNLVWQLVLESENPAVAPKAVKFLIQCFMSLDEALADERGTICQNLIS
jgi:hypothetical protein